MLNALSLLLAALALLFTLPSGAPSTPRAAEGEWVEVLSLKLETEAEQWELLTLDAGKLSASLARRLGQRAPAPEALRAARVGVRGEDWLMLSLTLSEGVVGLAVRPDGVVSGVALWDAQDFEEDPEGGWDVFTQQLGPTRQRLSAAPDAQPSASEVEALVEELEHAQGPDADLLRTLYEQRRRMRENSWRFTAMGQSRDRGEFPDAAWFVEWAENYSALAENAGPLLEVLGPDVGARYLELSRTGEASLRAGAEAITAGDRRALGSSIRGLYKQTCQACHQLNSEALGGPLYEQLLDGGLADFGVRSSLLQVGVDLWAVPTRQERSQEVADGVAALLAAAALAR